MESVQYSASLPVDWYRSADFFGKEQTEVFAKNWLFFAPAHDLKKPGDFITKKIANIPIVVIQNEDNMPRAFINICPHRGATLFAESCGHNKSPHIQCPYHGWVFGADGAIRSMSGPPPKDPKECAKFSLQAIQVASYQGLLFVHVDNQAKPFAQALAPLIEIWDQNKIDFAAYEAPLEKRVLGKFNWKVWIEGFQECHHCYYVHPQLKNDFMLKEYEVVNYDLFSVHSCKRKTVSEQTGQDDGVWSWIYPNIGLPVYEYCFYVLQVNPVAVDQTELIYYMFFAKGTSTEKKQIFLDFWQNLTKEDVDICENVQHNLASPYFRRGVLNQAKENGVVHFHQMIHRDVRTANPLALH